VRFFLKNHDQVPGLDTGFLVGSIDEGDPVSRRRSRFYTHVEFFLGAYDTLPKTFGTAIA
jgi:hypothetical protein